MSGTRPDLGWAQRGAVSFEGIGHTYRDAQGSTVHAIGQVDLEIAPGEFVALLGPSGCGKTTLLYALAGLVHPTAGSVRIDGRLVTGPGADRGVVFQEYALLPWKTVRANVALGPRLQGRSKADQDRLVSEYIAMVDLVGFEDRYPHELSGGMRQRVAVARTLAGDPAVLLMDEPFAAVDAQTRASLQRDLIRIWQETAKTVVFVTHDIAEAGLLADRVVVLGRRPSRIAAIVPVPMPRDERLGERQSAEHRAIQRQLESLLHGMGDDPDQRPTG
jgi:NitT/TauT family transport system ATP-binding protein